jgi:hypothetical protein
MVGEHFEVLGQPVTGKPLEDLDDGRVERAPPL